HDAVGGEEVLHAVALVRGEAGQRAVFLEAAGVEQQVDPLADGEPARRPGAGDALLPAHPPGQRLAPRQLVELRSPHRLRLAATDRLCHRGQAYSGRFFTEINHSLSRLRNGPTNLSRPTIQLVRPRKGGRL